MNDNLSNTIAELANRLGVKAEQLYPQLVEYVVAKELLDVTTSLVVFAIAIGVSFWLFALARIRKSNNKDGSDAWLAGSVFAVFAFAVAIGTAFEWREYLIARRFPDVAATRFILGK